MTSPIPKRNNRHSVFSSERTVIAPPFQETQFLRLNTELHMDGLFLLMHIPSESIPLVFLDPQYRSVLDKQHYGNIGRQKRRQQLPQMTDIIIKQFIQEAERILIPTGHLMLWVDKYIVCSGGIQHLTNHTTLQVVDMIIWNKGKIGMGYRSRRTSEYLVILQKPPIRAKGIWQLHTIPDVWHEKVQNRKHPHTKPIGLQEQLILATTNPGDVVVDPCAGSFSVMVSAQEADRNFLGSDIL